jgi:hypothetical protein
LEYDYEIGFNHDSNWQAGTIASAIYNMQRTKKSDKLWTPYDMGLGIRNHKVKVKSEPMNKEGWAEYKSMLKACGKLVGKGKKKEKK